MEIEIGWRLWSVALLAVIVLSAWLGTRKP